MIWSSLRIYRPDLLFTGLTRKDEIYTANMAKSDFFPVILRDDRACIAYAKAVSKDSDGYDGMIFKRWLTDCGGRGIQINWDLFI